MKTARRINAAIWAAIGITLVVGVCYEWHKQGCGWDSLIVGALWYTTASAGLCGVIDQTIKEHYQNQ